MTTIYKFTAVARNDNYVFNQETDIVEVWPKHITGFVIGNEGDNIQSGILAQIEGCTGLDFQALTKQYGQLFDIRTIGG